MLLSKLITLTILAVASVTTAKAGCEESANDNAPKPKVECDKDGLEPFWLQMEPEYDQGVLSVRINPKKIKVIGKVLNKFCPEGFKKGRGRFTVNLEKCSFNAGGCTELTCTFKSSRCTLACPSYKLDAAYKVFDLCDKDGGHYGHGPAELEDGEIHSESSQNNNAAIPICLPDTKFKICYDYVTGPWWLTGKDEEADGDASGYFNARRFPSNRMYRMAVLPMKRLMKDTGKPSRDLMPQPSSDDLLDDEPSMTIDEMVVEFDNMAREMEDMDNSLAAEALDDGNRGWEHYTHCSEPIGECKYGGYY